MIKLTFYPKLQEVTQLKKTLVCRRAGAPETVNCDRSSRDAVNSGKKKNIWAISRAVHGPVKGAWWVGYLVKSNAFGCVGWYQKLGHFLVNHLGQLHNTIGYSAFSMYFIKMTVSDHFGLKLCYKIWIFRPYSSWNIGCANLFHMSSFR